MKIAFLQDYNIFSFPGGAERNDLGHFKDGLKRGHDIRLFNPQDINNIDQFRPELLIISNATIFPKEKIREICSKYPYIFFLHDYFPICKWRLFYPMEEKCKSCINKEFWLPILKKSKLIIWLSPLHRDAWMFSCPELNDVPHTLVPSAVDTEKFKNLNKERTNDILNCNGLFDFKGRVNLINYAKENPNRHITIAGGGEPKDLPSNCNFIGYQSQEQLVELYNNHEFYIHLPCSVEPFGRVIVESYLSGCSLIVNNKVGATSYEWFKSREQVKENIKNATNTFWEAVEGAMK